MGILYGTLQAVPAAGRKFSDKQVAETLQLLVARGLERGANTVHIEPRARFVLVRYRIDGSLKGMHKLPRGASELLIRQLKALADLRPEETDVPQEGSFVTEAGGQATEVRLVILPVLGGEKAVLHLAPQPGALAGLESLGFWGANVDALHLALARPHGLVTVCGPKHAGKSTTLYALLKLLANPTHSIVTIEERASAQLPGVTQVFVPAGGSLLASLRTVIQQDPNVIMIGNVPNRGTARLAAETAVTGHLVLAEMAGAGAVAGLLQLRALGVEPFVLASALKLSIGQRRVRALCADCRERYQPAAAELQQLDKHFGLNTTNAGRLRLLEQQALSAGIGADLPLGTGPHGITHLWRANPDGCEACDHSGYRGQLLLGEVLEAGENVRRQLLKTGPVTVASMHKAALKDGFLPLGLDGLVKALRGETSAQEVLRATSAPGV